METFENQYLKTNTHSGKTATAYKSPPIRIFLLSFFLKQKTSTAICITLQFKWPRCSKQKKRKPVCQYTQNQTQQTHTVFNYSSRNFQQENTHSAWQINSCRHQLVTNTLNFMRILDRFKGMSNRVLSPPYKFDHEEFTQKQKSYTPTSSAFNIL